MSVALLNIGQKIKQERLKQKITKITIQTELNLSNKYLNQIEQGTLDEKLNIIIVSRYLKLYFQYLDMEIDLLLQKYKDDYAQENQGNNSHIIEKYDFIFPQKPILKLTAILLILFVIIAQIIEPTNNKKLLEKLSWQRELLLK